MPSRVTLLCTILSTVAVLSLAAQTTPQQADPQRPTFRTEANFVRVDVFPTRGGLPVRDLAVSDFEILEDGVAQRIESFEFVQVRAGALDPRRDPNTIAESRTALKDPRARVFVLFLDVPHVTIGGAWNVREPLVRLIDRILAPDDLIGIMTPRMAASDVVFARKTEVVAGGLRDRWPWGERFTLAEDEREYLYKACFPWTATQDVVREMVARRRERSTLDAMSELVAWLRNEREERKAVLTISEGWFLFQRNDDLTRPRVVGPNGEMEPIPGAEPIGTGPDGRLRVGNSLGTQTVSTTECHRDRQYLSQMDNERYFRDILADANRANTSFYAVDPRGLPVFDSPIGPEPPPPPSVDQQILNRRIDTLRVLADNTDGLAVVNSNDLEKGLRRMADDLTSYYLLGYYSTNTRLDGRFRNIKVRVKQPGIDVRARKGYRAATEKEITEARKAAAPAPVPESVALARSALAGLVRLRPSAAFRARAVAVGADPATIWVAGELSAPATAAATAEITARIGGGLVSATAAIAAGQRGFVVPLPLGRGLSDGVDIRVRIAEQAGQPALSDVVRVDPRPGLPDPLLFRRGPATGNRLEPLGEPSFSRTERARFDFPLAANVTAVSARILDRNGHAVELPVTVSERTDAARQRWASADVVLAPLGAGDYLLEVSGGADGAEHKVLTAFRVGR